MNSMDYLFAAYLVIWIVLAAYLYSIDSREKKLRKEIERLKQMIEKMAAGRESTAGNGE